MTGAPAEAVCRFTDLPTGAPPAVPNSYTGCVALPTAAAAEIAGAPGNAADGSHVPVVPSLVDDLPKMRAPGPPPFLRGYFASPSSAGAYTPGGFSWAILGSDPGAAPGGAAAAARRLEVVQGHYLSHECLGPYKYRAAAALVRARANGETTVEVFCEAGELDPAGGDLRVWLGNGTACPKTDGPPTLTSTRVGK